VSLSLPRLESCLQKKTQPLSERSLRSASSRSICIVLEFNGWCASSHS
jgi:hypothetical protein